MLPLYNDMNNSIKRLVAKFAIAVALLMIGGEAELFADEKGNDSIAEQFLRRVDLTRPELAELSRRADAGDYSGALIAYRDYFVEKCSRLPVETCRYWAFAYTNPEKLLDDGVVGMGAYGGKGTTAPVKIGKPGEVNWFPEVPKIPYFASDLPRFYWANKLARRYVADRDPRYLEAFVGYFADHARNHQRQYEAFMRTDWKGRYERPEWAVKTILFHADRLHVFRTGIIAACKTEGTVSFDREPAVPVVNASLEQIKQAIDPEELATALMGFADGTLNRFLDGRLNLPKTPNQQLDMAYCMLTYAHLLSAFKKASDWEEFAKQAYGRYFNAGAILADGTDMEQSFNYNWGPVGKTAGLLLWYPAPATRPDWVKHCFDRALYRLRMYAALVKPTGPVPGMGTYSATGNRDGFRENFAKFNTVFDDPLTAKVLNRQWGDNSMAAPAFKSIAFPYGGYYALRSGWDKRDQFLFFKASRPGVGHCEGNDILNIQLTSFGKDLLPRAGAVSYDHKDPFKPYFLHSFSANTVVVDGLSINTHPFQNKVATFHEPLDGRWHTSSAFDFTEGTYRHGYGKGNPSTISDVTHQRQIFFVKPAGLWIIVDRMNSDNEHAYTQIWNLHPDFAADQVVCDDAHDRFETQALAGPNVGLYHFGRAARSYTTFRGQMEPDVRGWARTQGGLVEATDIHVNWQGDGDQLLITLIEPRPALESAIVALKSIGENGFTATLRNGTEIAFQTVLTPQPLSAGPLKANAAALLTVRTLQGNTTRGIALDCTRFWDKQPAADSFEFEIEPGSSRRIGRPHLRSTPITVPTGFHWIDGRDGLKPRLSP